MKLNELIGEERILLNFDAENKDEAIGKLVDSVVNGFDRATVLGAILEREKLGSTGVGHGVAVPHVRIDSVETPVVVFGRSALSDNVYEVRLLFDKTAADWVTDRKWHPKQKTIKRKNGDIELTFNVDDGNSGTDSITLTIVIIANEPPMIIETAATPDWTR